MCCGASGKYWNSAGQAFHIQLWRVVVLGSPRLEQARKRAVASVKADADRFARNVAPIIREIKSSGVDSHRGIARALNARGVATARGGKWEATQVGAILRRA